MGNGGSKDQLDRERQERKEEDERRAREQRENERRLAEERAEQQRQQAAERIQQQREREESERQMREKEEKERREKEELRRQLREKEEKERREKEQLRRQLREKEEKERREKEELRRQLREKEEKERREKEELRRQLREMQEKEQKEKEAKELRRKYLEPMEIPWRRISQEYDDPWTEKFKEELESKLLSIKPGGNLNFLNVLVLGQAASGKTSFINTCDSAISNEGRVKARSTVLQASSASVTTRLEALPLLTQKKKIIPIRLFDCRGLHMENGVPTEDIRLIVYGHVKAGYPINPAVPISEENMYYRTNPGLEHKMHCIVYVASAENPTDNLADTTTYDQLKFIRDNLQQHNVHVPQFLLFTKIDRIEISNNQDLKFMFRSHNILDKCNEAAQYIGLPEMNVFPMSNYVSEQVQCLDKDILALFYVYTMMARANDFVKQVAGDDLPPGFRDDENIFLYVFNRYRVPVHIAIAIISIGVLWLSVKNLDLI